MSISLKFGARRRTSTFKERHILGLILTAMIGVQAIAAWPHDAPTSQLQWRPVIDANADATIQGIPYVPESAGQDWSIRRASKTTGDVTRFEIRQGDHWNEDDASGENKERSELDGYKKLWKERDDVWGAYSFLIEPGPAYHSDWTGISQMHGSKTRSFHIHFTNEMMTIYTEYLAGGSNPVATPRYSGKLSRGIWHNVVFHLRQNASNKGLFELWLDGKKVVDFTGSVGGAGNQAYWKFGIYRGYGPIATTFAIQFANMEVGTANLTARITNPLTIQ